MDILRAKPFGQAMAAVLAVAMPLLIEQPEGGLSYTEWVNVGVLSCGALLVWISENKPAGEIWNYTRLFVSLVVAGGVVVVSATSDGWPMTNVEWLQVIAATTGAGAVYEGRDAQSTGRHAAR